ncbi:Uncharacterised protein [Mycobacteroides abscessus subsp. massiliense]|nr:Uncharacterised protein [Mycobacteroides abscessus subsp. massiliense]
MPQRGGHIRPEITVSGAPVQVGEHAHGCPHALHKRGEPTIFPTAVGPVCGLDDGPVDEPADGRTRHRRPARGAGGRVPQLEHLRVRAHHGDRSTRHVQRGHEAADKAAPHGDSCGRQLRGHLAEEEIEL